MKQVAKKCHFAKGRQERFLTLLFEPILHARYVLRRFIHFISCQKRLQRDGSGALEGTFKTLRYVLGQLGRQAHPVQIFAMGRQFLLKFTGSGFDHMSEVHLGSFLVSMQPSVSRPVA